MSMKIIIHIQFFQIFFMGPKRNKSKIRILTSLYVNQKNSNFNNNFEDFSDIEDGEGALKKSMKNDDNSCDAIFNCDICHATNHHLPKLNHRSIKNLNEKEKQLLDLKLKMDVKILCMGHYQNEIVKG